MREREREVWKNAELEIKIDNIMVKKRYCVVWKNVEREALRNNVEREREEGKMQRERERKIENVIGERGGVREERIESVWVTYKD